MRKIIRFIKPSVRSQDSVTVICAVSGNTSTKLSSELAWQFIKENWGLLYSRYSSGFLITRLVKVSVVKWKQLDYIILILLHFFRVQLKTLQQKKTQ